MNKWQHANLVKYNNHGTRLSINLAKQPCSIKINRTLRKNTIQTNNDGMQSQNILHEQQHAACKWAYVCIVVCVCVCVCVTVVCVTVVCVWLWCVCDCGVCVTVVCVCNCGVCVWLWCVCVWLWGGGGFVALVKDLNYFLYLHVQHHTHHPVIYHSMQKWKLAQKA